MLQLRQRMPGNASHPATAAGCWQRSEPLIASWVQVINVTEVCLRVLDVQFYCHYNGMNNCGAV